MLFGRLILHLLYPFHWWYSCSYRFNKSRGDQQNETSDIKIKIIVKNILLRNEFEDNRWTKHGSTSGVNQVKWFKCLFYYICSYIIIMNLNEKFIITQPFLCSIIAFNYLLNRVLIPLKQGLGVLFLFSQTFMTLPELLLRSFSFLKSQGCYIRKPSCFHRIPQDCQL